MRIATASDLSRPTKTEPTQFEATQHAPEQWFNSCNKVTFIYCNTAIRQYATIAVYAASAVLSSQAVCLSQSRCTAYARAQARGH